MSDLCLKNEAYTVFSALVRSRRLCRISSYRTRHTQCVARLFVRVAYVGSFLIERGIHVCSALVRSRGLCRIFSYRTRHTQCVARLFVSVTYVGSLLIERGIHSV